MSGFFTICNAQSQLTTLSKTSRNSVAIATFPAVTECIEAHQLLLEEFSASDVATLGFSAHRVCHFAARPLWAEDVTRR
jgi:hypothetical protein